jgi:hypothetical protein
MDIHKPKPVHSWREFAKEVGIIVLGVLIALAAEQLVEMLRWRGAVSAGREALHREIAFDDGYFRDRLTTATCMDRRLAAITALIAAAANGKPPAGLGEPSFMGPGRLTLVAEWNAEQASQTLTHFPRGELSKLGAWYDQLQTMRGWIEQEEVAWAQLGTLTLKGPLGAQDVALLRQDLQTARYLEFLMVLNASRELDRGRELGVTPDPPRRSFVDPICNAPPDQPLSEAG